MPPAGAIGASPVPCAGNGSPKYSLMLIFNHTPCTGVDAPNPTGHEASHAVSVVCSEKLVWQKCNNPVIEEMTGLERRPF